MRSIVIGTAGHIDHGKSALVRALTGIDPDRLKEEQARGITIDLGFAHLESDGVNLAFVDVPGHERFVKNMLAGAGGVDLAMLVVAADESVMPQTREHFQICRLLHIPAGVVVLTKADLADADTIELAKLEVRELTAGSFLAEAPVVVVSARTGVGLDQLRHTLVDLARSVRERDREGHVRLPIDRVFSVKGFGTVVTGTLVSGTIHDETELVVLPRERVVKVRGLQVHGQGQAEADPGHRVAVNLGGVEVGEIARGDTLCARRAFEPTQRLDALVELLPDARPLRHGSRVRFHQGTTELLGRVAVAADRVERATLAQIEPGMDAYARIRLETPAVLTRGDRFILRAYSPSITIGGGVVLDPHPPRIGVRTTTALERFRRLDGPDGTEGVDSAVLAMVDERGESGLPTDALISRAGLAPSSAEASIGRLVRAGSIVRVADLLVSPLVLRGLGERLLTALKTHHQAQPLSEGLPREEARERLFGRSSLHVFDHVLATLAAERQIVVRDRLALAGHRVALSGEDLRTRDEIERILRDAGLAPPDAATLQTLVNAPAPIVDRIAALLVRQKTLVKLDALLFHADALAQLKADVRGLKANARVDVPAFKERYGITRKYAIPLLEYLDRERITRRVGDARVVL
ncbi:MAG TPA: selenocysteine-specific translation elongation factor [Vicinamibacterales bacterium]|jgi:selenocysteine-specific elongation factor|nr:selenocysteine-specific translation elongation factor [Vicinamibacterales bacterium]